MKKIFAMTVLEIKGQMLQLISEVDDRPTLERLLHYFFKVVKKEKTEEEDWWDELTIEQQQQLLNILDAARAGKNLLSNEEAWNRLKRWSA